VSLVLDGLKRRRAGAITARLDGVASLGTFSEGAARDLAVYLEATTALLSLAARSPADDQLKRDAGRAVDQARRLAKALADDLHGVRGEKDWVDLGELVRLTVLIAQRAVASPVPIAVEVAPDVGLVCGVACELEQMVLNLVLTVRAWLPDHGAIEIRVTRTVSAVAIVFTSSGGDRRTTTNPLRSVKTGSLGTVRRVLHRHRATMASAPRPNGGTEIRVLIPSP
jgi:signal transduction histidine kinase